MSGHLGNRMSTPEAASSTLRPPTHRASMGPGHHLRASADMGGYAAAPMSSRGIRPASEIYSTPLQNFQNLGVQEDTMDKATQQWIADIDQYETTLEEMAAATLDQDFKDELSAIEQWFCVLSEAERTAALYALLRQTTQVQIRFFIGVLEQMTKSHPVSSVLSPANFNEKDPMSSRLSSAMNKLNPDSRNSLGPSRLSANLSIKRNSGLDPDEINSMFPDAAAAIAKQKADFTQHISAAPTSNRNSVLIGDRSSLITPAIAAPHDDTQKKDVFAQPLPPSPWGQRSSDSQQSTIRPKSSSGFQPMGQFSQPLRSPRPMTLSGGDNILQNTTVTASDNGGMPLLSPYPAGASWASISATPMAPNFSHQQSANSQADMVANATAMKLAALSTVNNRIQFDDVRKYRRARSSEDQQSQSQTQMQTATLPSNFIMTNENGQILSPNQVAQLQAQQLAAISGQRSRPSSPGMAFNGSNGHQSLNLIPQSNGYLSAYDSASLLNNSMASLSFSQPHGHTHGHTHGHYSRSSLGGNEAGYTSDASDFVSRGRSPRGKRGSSRPPEDPTDIELLKDIPGWLRSLRLHKYTDNLRDLKWTELVKLDDEGLEKRGVLAVGARRKMTKVFEQVREAQARGEM